MAPTLRQWQTQLTTHLSTALTVPLTAIGNPTVGGDSPLGFCDDTGAYIACDVGDDGLYLTREPWPTQRSHFERAPRRCEESPAAHLVARLVLCVPTGDSEGRPVDAVRLDASAESVAASGVAFLAALADFTTLDAGAGRPTCTLGPVRAVPKSGGAMAWEADLTVPLPCV